MGYLLMAILCSASVAIAMRVGKNYGKNQRSMLAVNYVCCTMLAAGAMGAGSFRMEKSSIGLGIIQGIMYLTSFVLFQYSIKKNGVVLSATFMKLGVLVPTLAAIFLFHEQPSRLQILGVGLSVFAIVFMNYEKGEGTFQFSKSLIFLMIAGGLTDIMVKIYDQYGDLERKGQFIFFTFFVAMILCIGLAVKNKERLSRQDFLCGIAIGIPNYFSAVFLLKAIHTVLATIAYSTYSVASIACTTIAGVLIFKEKLTKRQAAGLGIILTALMCLNL